MLRKKLFFLTFLLLLLGGGHLWAETTIKMVEFTTTTWTGVTIEDGSTIDDCYIKGSSTTATSSDGLTFNNNMKVSNYYVAIPLTGINGSITVTIEGQSRPNLRYALTSNKETLTSVIDIPRPSSGTSVTFTINDINSSSTYLCLGRNGSGNTIKTVTVTTPEPAVDASQTINIADLRFEHLTYSPSRSNIAGFNLSFAGWQSQTTTGSPNTYSLLLSERSKTDNTITISTNSANSARKIKQVVLVGASNGTFTNSAPSSDYTYSTTNADQIVWRNETGANTATISISATDQPAISEIWVYTDAAMVWTKNDIALAFSPASGTAAISQTDYSIDGRVIISGTSEYFRPDDFTAASVSGKATFNTFHLSTGKVGVNTVASAGTATITATFDETSNPFYNTATEGTYTLNVVDASTHTKTITIDDMRISKTASSNGINSSDNNLDRILGGFQFAFSGGEGVKFNNGDGILLRKSGSDLGQITITPKKKEGITGDISISRIDITTNASYTNGTVKVNNTGSGEYINNVSSYSFIGLSSGTVTLAAVDGTGDDDRIYITGFTIYYTDTNGVLDESKTPTSITFSKSSDEVSSVGSYTSPTITTSPKNFDITLSSSNTNVASVSTTNWSSNAVSLQGATGTATITASAAASTYFNAATDATYTVTYVDAAAQKWDFRTLNVANTINDTDWKKSGDYYENKFTSTGRFNTGTATTYATTASTTSQIYQLLFGRDNSDGLKAGQIRLFSNYMTFTNSAITIAVPVTEGDKVHVTFDGGNGSTLAGFTFTNAQLESDPSATSITSDDNQTTATLVAQATGYVTLEVSKSKVKLYRIQVSTETRKTLSLRDTSNNYEKNVGTDETASTNNHFSHRVMFTPSDGATDPVTYADDASRFHITSSDPSVLDVSNTYIPESSFGRSSSFYFANLIPKSAGTATLTITFDGNDNYKPNSYVSQTYTVYGPGSFSVSANDQEIQKGQLSTIIPIITDKNGNPIGIMEMNDGSGRYTTYILGEDDDIPEYTDFFDFTYTAGTGSGTNYSNITVDESGNITTGSGDGEAAVGATRLITVTATPKSAYESAFSSTSAVTKDITVTIIEKTADVQVEFYWDAACSAKITMADPDASPAVTGDDNTYADKVWTFNSGKFASGFPNGRILYVKPKNEGDAIWFSYAQDANAAVIPANPTLDRKNRVYQYRRGIPIYIDETLSGSNYVNVNVVATTYDASTKKYTLRGTVARLKFPKIVAHERPAEPTYDPISPDADASLNKDGRKIMNTSENVVAYGEGASKTTTGVGNLVYGKFSTGTVYTTEQLINENAVQLGTNSVPVVSTEVAKRRFTAVQVKPYDDTYGKADYISEQTYTEYWYLFDTDLRLYSDAEKTTPLQSIDLAKESNSVVTPYYKVTWYNKRNYDDPGNYSLGVTQEIDDYAGKITYEIDARNGAAYATVNATTGIVTAGNETGWVRVKATYSGGEEHGGKSGEPQYKSTTDESEAYFYVYIYDASKERPVITPPTRNFTGTMKFKVQAPETWSVRYTIDGSEPSPSNGYELAANTYSEWTIGDITTNTELHNQSVEVGTDNRITVKAIAYHIYSEVTHTSDVYSETYTRYNPLPDPVFDPSGVKTPYIYNTNELIVQIACAYAGSVIYYTISDKTTEGNYPDPVIGADNTYRYSGLSKVTVTGDKVIKAIAYDPVQQIYSKIVTSVYQYSNSMYQPYYQISNDGGLTWLGFTDESSSADESTCTANGTKWYNGQTKAITPTTLIRIVDPNPVKGNIYYTVGESPADPSDDATSLVYMEGYPFTLGRPSVSKAIVTLEDAASLVSSATFTMTSSDFYVWEAVDETMTDSTHVENSTNYKGIHIADGFVISTKKGLSVRNTGTIVNLHSIKSGEGTDEGGTATKTYAQKYITATFGGYDLASWEQMTIADAATGTPIDGVAQYSIKTINNTGKGNGNARDENDSNYNHIYSYKTTPTETGESAVAAKTHEKTFKVPAMGGYVRFEPEKDGDLTIWCLQQGALLYEDDKYFIDNVLRIRPVYLVDEQGESQKVKVVNGVPQLWSAARLSENWAKIQATAASNSWMNSEKVSKDGKWDMVDKEDYAQYLRKSDGVLFPTKPSDYDSNKSAYKRLLNKGPNRTETAAIYQLYKADLDKNHVNIGDPIKPFALHTGSSLSLNDGMYVDDSNDGTGYVLASGGFAKYTFEVKAGKTYYFFAQGSKIGIRGFQFVPTETTETEGRTSVTINPNPDSGKSEYSVDGVAKTLAETKTACADKPVNVTLNRTFKKDTWTSLVLPFSVSTTQLDKLFGDGTVGPEVLHFLDVTQSGVHWRLRLMQHYHQMLVAGTPVLIKAAKDVKDPVFEGVQIEADAVTPMTVGDYTMKGTFVQQTGTTDEEKVDWLKSGDYFMANSGKFMRWTGVDTAMRGTYAWLHPDTQEAAARVLDFSFEDYEGVTTGIIEVEIPAGSTTFDGIKDGAVYDLNGRKVSQSRFTNLPKGVYIVNGKKMIID